MKFDTMLEISNLNVEVNGKMLLQDINITIPNSGWSSIIGPNGSGKTTLLRCILGVIPYTGTVQEAHLDQKSNLIIHAPNFSSPKSMKSVYRNLQRNVAYIAQKPVYPVGMTVAQYVSLASLKNSKVNLKRILEELEIYGLYDQSLATLSGGELQLVSIARAIAQNPDLILLDEPTSALDIHHQSRALALISNLRDSGIPIISVMHDLSAAAFYSDRLALLNQGRLLIYDQPDLVINSPLLANAFENAIDILNLESGRSIVVGKETRGKKSK